MRINSIFIKALNDNTHLLINSDDEEENSPKSFARSHSENTQETQNDPRDALKERSNSIQSSNSVASAASAASSTIVNMVQTARDRITTSSKGLVSVFINPPTEAECDESNHEDEHNNQFAQNDLPDNGNDEELDKTVEDKIEETPTQNEPSEN
jgi:hypothetical protein